MEKDETVVCSKANFTRCVGVNKLWFFRLLLIFCLGGMLLAPVESRGVWIRESHQSLHRHSGVCKWVKFQFPFKVSHISRDQQSTTPETIESAAQTRHLKTSCEAPSEAALSETSAPVDLSPRRSFILSQLRNLHLMERLRRAQSVSRTAGKSSTECQDGIDQK